MFPDAKRPGAAPGGTDSAQTSPEARGLARQHLFQIASFPLTRGNSSEGGKGDDLNNVKHTLNL